MTAFPKDFEILSRLAWFFPPLFLWGAIVLPSAINPAWGSMDDPWTWHGGDLPRPFWINTFDTMEAVARKIKRVQNY